MGDRLECEGTYNILAVVVPTIQDQSDHQDERIYNATLDRVHDHASVEGIQPVVRSDLCRALGLSDPPDEEAGDDDVGHEGYGEEGGRDVLDSGDEGGLAGGELGEFPDRHRDQCSGRDGQKDREDDDYPSSLVDNPNTVDLRSGSHN